MKKQIFKKLFVLILGICLVQITHAQVTIGTSSTPTYGALLDLKNQQAGTVTAVGDDTNITSTNGGLLLPRVKITGFTSLNSVVVDGDALTPEEKRKLAGLMVYNINAVANVLYLGVYVWNGEAWTYLVDSKVSSPMTVGQHPTAFSFYETGIAADKPVEPLTFVVNPPKAADGTIGSVSYQWYQLIGSNLHATVGAVIGTSGTVTGLGATTDKFTPTGVLKGTTRNANYAGFYRFYCEAKGSDGSLVRSDIVEVAVGCGAKNNLGEWLTFMCFNLGSDLDMTIEKQKTYIFGPYSYNSVGGIHEYVADEEKVWGDLFQWGRIPDGHEKRNTPSAAKGALSDANIGDGYKCTVTDRGRPYYQVKKDATTWYGHFIYSLNATNWGTGTDQTVLDGLWRSGRFVNNDPCSHFKTDGSFQEFWHEGTNAQNDSPACIDSNTAWRLASAEEWGAIYKGGTISGSPTAASANTWKWYQVENGATNLTKTRGYEVQPDGQTTTLFLPAGGNRASTTGFLYYSGVIGYYWTSTTTALNAYIMSVDSNAVNPGNSGNRAGGFALRCIKHQ